MVLEDFLEDSSEPIIDDSDSINPERLHEIRQLPLSIRLAQLRALYGYTQDDVTAKIKVTKSLVSKWETEVCTPSSRNIMKLAALYNLPLSYFMSEPEIKNHKRKKMEE